LQDSPGQGQNYPPAGDKTRPFNERSRIQVIISALQSFGDVTESVDLDVAKLTAVSVFALDKNEIVAMEPGTTIYSQELIEIPEGLYAAFRLELRVSAVHGGFISKKNRKWRAFSIALDVDDADSEKQKKE
jgi:hypothetical protein